MLVEGNKTENPYYIRPLFTKEPDLGVAIINYDLADLLARATDAEGSL
ncbi:hypothetical protein [Aeromonas sobria]|nr:hypothetical protein [Aeromonas sobria]